jgi:hypothetical protein
MIYVRLVCHDDPLSWAILKNIGGIVAHGEGVMKGGTVIGAFAEGGVQERKLDYDGGKFAKEILFELPADDEMSAKFEHYLRSPEVMGEAYDYPGIANFMHFGIDMHAAHHVFCSALIHDDLRFIKWWPRPMPIPGHYVNPLILHQELLADQRTRIVTRDDPAFLAHIAQGQNAA